MVDNQTLVSLTADIVVAHLSHNNIGQSELPMLISSVHAALAGVGSTTAAETAPEQAPAVSIRASVKPDYLVCLEDGKKLKTLKRHLMVHFGLTPDAYRAKWKLPKDYPMVAPNYATRRRELALSIGLGKAGRDGAVPAAETPANEPAAAQDKG
ncbi:MucR family transcriptional regulator [Sphingomonas sp. 35-24ZXX]|uniref:MucR family transcriptional regulator n=1 Tax=Sphingomonas sp. 35-24ZXX TaxID=1545915 RepID=UPI00068D0669|nr:MucR family transcriptional regulator [Sphingomonas sp. 35-24ZXX]